MIIIPIGFILTKDWIDFNQEEPAIAILGASKLKKPPLVSCNSNVRWWL